MSSQYKKALKFIILSFAVCVSTLTYSQSSISGNVIDNQNKPLEYVTVEFIKDTLIIGITTTDSLGNYKIPNLTLSKYTVRFSFVGFDKKDTAIILVSDIALNVQLAKAKNNLNEVTVRSKKPLFERKSDRFIFNVANSDLVVGNNVWDVLKRTPLIHADDNGGIVMLAKQSVTIYINNKKTQLSGDALYNQLKNTPAGNIIKIEVITNPPSNYDAAGGGVINIILKKADTEGFQGRVALNDNQGYYNSQSISVTSNYKKSKIGISFNPYIGNSKNRITEQSEIEFKNNTPHLLNSNNYNRIEPSKYYGSTLAVDYDINKNQTISFGLDISKTISDYRYTNTSSYKSINSVLIDSILKTNNPIESNDYNINLNANYKVDVDKNGTYFIIDANHFNFLDDRSSKNISFLDAQPNTYRQNFLTTLPQKINNTTVAVDYYHPFNPKTNLSIGLKESITNDDNDMFTGVWNGTQYAKDYSQSNHFKYTENIFAAYTTITRTLNKYWESSIGLRVENTKTKGEQIDTHQLNEKNYTNFFPTLFLSYSPNQNHQFSYSITNRIIRPAYWELNPFRFYNTPTIYVENNPLLQPQKIIKQEISYTLLNKYTFLLNHSYTRDVYSQFIINNSNNNIIKYLRLNYGKSNEIDFAATMSNSFFKEILEATCTATFGYIHYKGEINIPNYLQAINTSTAYGDFDIDNTIHLSKQKKWKMYVFAHYTTPYTLDQGGVLKNTFSFNLGINKKIKDLSISILALDIFKTMSQRYTIENINSKNDISIYNNSQQIKLIVNYKFGNQKAKTVRNRENANTDIKNRTNH